MTIGSNIKKLRTGQGMTQDQLAEKLFVTRQTVSNWERGASQPNLEQLEAIAAALGVEVMELLYGPKPKEGPSRKRLLAGGICSVTALILWAMGKFWIAPAIEGWVQRHYQMGQVYFYELVYEGAMVFLLVLGPLLLASAIWNFELKKTDRRVCLALGIVLGLVWLSSWGFVLAMVFTEWHAPFHRFFVYLVNFQYEAWGSVVEGIAVLFLFLALNPPRKKTAEETK
ncbi:MAG: helix-turn-helix transcriptional regulator [Ruminiclostridium sp.]|nr:helix-turn-helix transcriptional regulator [Ruminiclostridium sp.]